MRKRWYGNDKMRISKDSVDLTGIQELTESIISVSRITPSPLPCTSSNDAVATISLGKVKASR